ncbi:MAG: NTP transferase domain-containing protein [Elusimicrobiales bacterium]|nr:NTP transferase domain-containing protein [Elusimicrobiales bacterium]
MDRKLIYIIPMAGLGSRFVKAGYDIPKYMIPVRGATVFEHAMRSLPLEPAGKIIFVALRDHQRDHDLEKFIGESLRRLPAGLPPGIKTEIILLEKPTSGQAETVLKARDAVPPGAGLAIYNIDTHFSSATLAATLAGPEKKDGVIGAFTLEEADPKWSFAALGPDGTVAETAEKKQISGNALTGFYHFTDAEGFFRVAAAALTSGEKTNGELYVAPLYNALIREGHKFVLDRAGVIVPLGTPEDIVKAEAHAF